MGERENSTTNHTGLTFDSLKGRQSVRATFRLPAHVIKLLSLSASQLGIKQKSLFDQLIEDQKALERLAQKAKGYSLHTQKRSPKTYVISRKSLSCLDQIAKRYKLPRDVLVEVSINRLRPVISAEQEKHRNRKILMKDIDLFLAQGKKLLGRSRQVLEEGDPFMEIIETMMGNCEKKYRDLIDIVTKGESVGNDDSWWQDVS